MYQKWRLLEGAAGDLCHGILSLLPLRSSEDTSLERKGRRFLGAWPYTVFYGVDGVFGKLLFFLVGCWLFVCLLFCCFVSDDMLAMNCFIVFPCCIETLRLSIGMENHQEPLENPGRYQSFEASRQTKKLLVASTFVDLDVFQKSLLSMRHQHLFTMWTSARASQKFSNPCCGGLFWKGTK